MAAGSWQPAVTGPSTVMLLLPLLLVALVGAAPAPPLVLSDLLALMTSLPVGGVPSFSLASQQQTTDNSNNATLVYFAPSWGQHNSAGGGASADVPNHIHVARSTDNGLHWALDGRQATAPPLPQNAGIYLMPLITSLPDEKQLLLFNFFPTSPSVGIGSWNGTDFDWPTNASELVPVYDKPNVEDGITHAVIRLKSGRLVHVGDYGTGVTAAFSDNGGTSWTTGGLSTCQRYHYGCGGEPTAVELENGTIWVLTRRAMANWAPDEGSSVLWQSWSDDGGVSFRGGKQVPSQFISFNAPAMVLRLRHNLTRLVGLSGEPPIVVLFNNGRQLSRFDGGTPENARSLLHATISLDGGLMWQGHREVLRDPLLKLKAGNGESDHGVSYSQAVEQSDGSILIGAGQMAGHWGMARLDPLWLLETEQAVDFSTLSGGGMATTSDFSGSYINSCAFQSLGGFMPRGRIIYCTTCFSKECPRWNTSNPACRRQQNFEVLSVAFQPSAGSTVYNIGGSGWTQRDGSRCECTTGCCGLPWLSLCGATVIVTKEEFRGYDNGGNLTCAKFIQLSGARARSGMNVSAGATNCSEYDGVRLRSFTPTATTIPSPSSMHHHHQQSAAPTSAAEPQKALCVALEDNTTQATATYNFPSASTGRLQIRLALQQPTNNFSGAVISLSDHYAPPWDTRLSPSVSLYAIRIGKDGHIEIINGSASAPPLPKLPSIDKGSWHDLDLEWDIVAGLVKVTVDGKATTGFLPAILRHSNQGSVNYCSVQSLGPGGICVASLRSSRSTKTDDDDEVVAVGTREHLLLWGDSALTANTTLVAQTHPPRKTGVMAVVADKPWEFLIFAWTSVLKVNDSDYRIYYDAFGAQKNVSHRYFCVATSTDGTTYTKPNLGLVPFEGSTQNNIVGVVELGPEPLATSAGTVFIDTHPRTPASERFKLVGHNVYGSADGFAWRLLSVNHISFSDTLSAAFYDESTAMYSIYYRTHAHGAFGPLGCPSGDAPERSIGMFQTDNLTAPSWGPGDQRTENSSLVDTIFNVDSRDPPCMDIYTSAAVKVADATFIFPQQYLHCNAGRSTPTIGGGLVNRGCAYSHDDGCPTGSTPLSCNSTADCNPFHAPHPSCHGVALTCLSNRLCGAADTGPGGLMCVGKVPEALLPVSAPVPCAGTSNDGLLDVGFAASRDGRSFERFDRQPFLSRGPGKPRTACAAEQGRAGGAVCSGVWEGDWDSGSTNMAVGTMDRGTEETIMLGQGMQYTHGGYINFTEPGGAPVLSGLQILTMRRHGFVSLRPRRDDSNGTLLTRLLKLPKCTDASEDLILELNIQTAMTGSAIVELLPETAALDVQALRSIVLVGNSAHLQVQFTPFTKDWTARVGLPTSVQGAVARLSFQLVGNADLYGFQFICNSQSAGHRLKSDDVTVDLISTGELVATSSTKRRRRVWKQRSRTVASSSNSGGQIQQAKLVAEQASEAFAEGRLDDAIKLWELQVQLEPDNAAAHTNLGLTQRDIGDTSRARASLWAAARADPDSPAPYFFLSTLERSKFGALRVLQRGAALDPSMEDIVLHQAVANMLFVTGSVNAAATYLERIADTSTKPLPAPFSDWAIVHLLAECYSKLFEAEKYESLLWRIYKEAPSGSAESARAAGMLARQHYAYGRPSAALLLAEASVRQSSNAPNSSAKTPTTSQDGPPYEALYGLALARDLAGLQPDAAFASANAGMIDTVRRDLAISHAGGADNHNPISRFLSVSGQREYPRLFMRRGGGASPASSALSNSSVSMRGGKGMAGGSMAKVRVTRTITEADDGGWGGLPASPLARGQHTDDDDDDDHADDDDDDEPHEEDLDLCTIERREAATFSRGEFEREFVYPGRPVIIAYGSGTTNAHRTITPPPPHDIKTQQEGKACDATESGSHACVQPSATDRSNSETDTDSSSSSSSSSRSTGSVVNGFMTAVAWEKWQRGSLLAAYGNRVVWAVPSVNVTADQRFSHEESGAEAEGESRDINTGTVSGRVQLTLRDFIERELPAPAMPNAATDGGSRWNQLAEEDDDNHDEDSDYSGEDHSQSSSSRLYLFRSQNLAPGIAEDIRPGPLPYFGGEDGDAFSEWGQRRREDSAIFFLGPTHSGAYFHQHFAAWNALLYGAKRWFMLPPDAVFGKYNDDMLHWLEHVKPLLPIAPLECVQRSGDVVFVPEGWQHATINLANSVGIATELGPVDSIEDLL